MGGAAFKLVGAPAFIWLCAVLCSSPGLSAPGIPDAYCGAGEDFKLDEQEPRCLKLLSQLANRKGNALLLHLQNGKTKTIKSNPAACDKDDASNCVRSYLVGYHGNAGLFIIAKTYYEGWEYFLISAQTGKETSLGDRPHFAPDESTFVIVNPQEEYSQPYYFAVGTTATIPPSISWKSSEAIAGEWEFHNWVDRDHVELTLATTTQDCPKPPCEGVLVRAGTGWKLDLVRAKR